MKEKEKYEELTCFEVEIAYKSGRKRSEIIDCVVADAWVQ